MSTIRIPKNKGIVGHVAMTGVMLKIDEAYSDPRFNKEIDTQNKYKTRNILCAPVKDSNGKTIGI